MRRRKPVIVLIHCYVDGDNPLFNFMHWKSVGDPRRKKLFRLAHIQTTLDTQRRMSIDRGLPVLHEHSNMY